MDFVFSSYLLGVFTFKNVTSKVTGWEALNPVDYGRIASISFCFLLEFRQKMWFSKGKGKGGGNPIVFGGFGSISFSFSFLSKKTCKFLAFHVKWVRGRD